MGRHDAEIVPVLEEGGDERRHQRLDRHRALSRLADDPVVHVGEVHDVKHLVAARLEPAPEQVDQEEGPEIPDVGVVPDRRAAGIQGDPGRFLGMEFLDPPGEGVVKAEGHAPSPGTSAGSETAS